MAAPVRQNGEVVGSLLVASLHARPPLLRDRAGGAHGVRRARQPRAHGRQELSTTRCTAPSTTRSPGCRIAPLFLDRARALPGARAALRLGRRGPLPRPRPLQERQRQPRPRRRRRAARRRRAPAGRSACVPGDTVARFGGDEFAVLVEERRATDQVDGGGDAHPRRARGAVRDPREERLRQREHRHRDRARAAPTSSLRNADLAMYRAKSAGGGRYERFEPNMHAAVVERLELEVELRAAVENEDFVLHFQPIISLDDGRHRRGRGARALGPPGARPDPAGRRSSRSPRRRG